jgi:parallel beta-helix repeat protein
MEKAMTQPSADAAMVNPGESIQAALDIAAPKKGWVVAKSGFHKLQASLKIPSGVTLSGEGLSTVVLLDPASGLRDAIVSASDDLHDVTICDLVVEGAADPDPGSDPNSKRSYRSTANRGGILFPGKLEGAMKNITLRNLTVRNSTYNGIFISGAEKLTLICCDLSENGASVVPGPRLQHNLLLTHCKDVKIADSRMGTSPQGCGISLASCTNVSVTNCETARNGWFGMLVSECRDISISNNLVEANDSDGIMIQYLYSGSENVRISNNLVQFNNGFGTISYAGKNIKTSNNTYSGNGFDLKSDEKISAEKYILMNRP